ncbi:hypothetical protein [Rhodococcus sp. IEGM 1318]|uniref:hypothetical protein n=1 Tax=Rhodococcus sp. IEGM 1318 TaxID=3082226 RepID=UPI0029550886|nr:hypothetical protein [Rhodococcus sp. IEGM 1318]MDV8004008.1 hypothetical protein [Rhodococcus sp. IEGM 1318]
MQVYISVDMEGIAGLPPLAHTFSNLFADVRHRLGNVEDILGLITVNAQMASSGLRSLTKWM